MPNSRFKIFWNFVIIILLLYTATFITYRVAFIDTDSELLIVLDYIMDTLFGIDIIINFISAYEISETKVETWFKKIAKKYVLSWFVLDTLAIIPFQSIDFSSEDDNTD